MRQLAEHWNQKETSASDKLRDNVFLLSLAMAAGVLMSNMEEFAFQFLLTRLSVCFFIFILVVYLFVGSFDDWLHIMINASCVTP